MRALGYVRVSTANQALGDGPAAQEDAIRAWAEEGDHELVGVVADNGKSGALDETERPGLLEALRRLEDGEAEALVVHRLDRLARELHVQEAVLLRVWQQGGSIWEVIGGEVLRDDPDDPYRTFLRQVMGAASQLERGLIVARLQGGRRRKADRAGYVGGKEPYGFRLDGDRLVPVPEERKVVARIRRLRKRGRTLREIADRLNADGVPAKQGGAWHATSVRSVLLRQEGDR